MYVVIFKGLLTVISELKFDYFYFFVPK